MSRTFFLHGLESGPHGSKYQALRAAFPDTGSPDFSGMMDFDTRLRKALDAGVEGVLVGSSFGGAVAFAVAQAHPERVRALVLCAPAWRRIPSPTILDPTIRVTIIHGTSDEVIPYTDSLEWAGRYCPSATVIPADDGHRLGGSLDLIVDAVRRAHSEISAS
jgi:pimeloyl-ACP methyl ester carboxylesterase